MKIFAQEFTVFMQTADGVQHETHISLSSTTHLALPRAQEREQLIYGLQQCWLKSDLDLVSVAVSEQTVVDMIEVMPIKLSRAPGAFVPRAAPAPDAEKRLMDLFGKEDEADEQTPHPGDQSAT